MNDDELKRLFEDAAEAAPSDEARARARAAAMAAFAAANRDAEKNSKSAQGNVVPLRPIAEHDRSEHSNGRTEMNKTNKRWLMGGVASAAALVLTVSVMMRVNDPMIGGGDMAESPEVSMAEPELARDREVMPTKPAPAARSEVAQLRLPPAEQVDALESRADMPAMPAKMAPPSSAPAPRVMAKMQAAGDASPAPEPQFVSAMPSMEANEGIAPQSAHQGRDKFEDVDPSPVKLVSQEPVSTFSVDVDTASYSFVRRQLNQGVLPQKDAVRVEEMINYFDYDYPLPESRETPFKATVSVTDAPWKPGNKLIHIGIRGYDIAPEETPASNLVFLLDVSGSMNSPDKLPLVKQSMGLLLSQLKPSDTVAIVAYAGAAGTVLEPTEARHKQKILAAMGRLSAGGSTAGGQGIKLAYQLAQANFDEEAVNRVILATDGDFNVGISNREELKGFVERQRESGIYLSVLGFGQGNYNDHMMQALAQNGNGVAAYIDTLSEAQKVLVDEATSTLFPIAKDVKIQMEFNPDAVQEYRLLGYETRALKREDFNNDKVDAGDIGAGHRVTAIYEITPVGADSGLIDPPRYPGNGATEPGEGDEYGFLKMRYKLPEESSSKLITTPVLVEQPEMSEKMQQETSFATAVAGFAELLRGGEYSGDWTYQNVIDLGNRSKGDDLYGYRAEFVQLARKAAVAEGMR
jgi:Ca-activated chloride channel family protein